MEEIKKYYCIMSYDEYKERSKNVIESYSYFEKFDDAQVELFEEFYRKKKRDINILEFDSSKELNWNYCICIVETIQGIIVNKYPVRYYYIKKGFKTYDHNPVRLIDIMFILRDDYLYSIYVDNKDCYAYKDLSEIPEEFFNYTVTEIGEIILAGVIKYKICLKKEN